MKIGSKTKFSEVQARHWVQFANDAQLSPAQVKKRILDIAKRLPNLALSTQAALQAQGNGHPTLGQIVTLIDQRCTLTIRRLTATEDDDGGAMDPRDEPEDDGKGRVYYGFKGF